MKLYTGFTLVELLITIVIVGILSAVAIPMYSDYIKKSGRTDGVSALLNLQLAQERYRATHPRYSSSITAADASGGLAMLATSEQGFYDLAVVSADANSFVMSAGPVGGGKQAGDMCVSTNFRIDQSGPVVTTAAEKQCWSR